MKPHKSESLHVFEALPEGFLGSEPSQLNKILPGPSLIVLEGQRNPPLFVSTMLHGNEHSSFEAIQLLLSK